MAKRAQRQTGEPELDFELRRIGYLERGLTDLPGQAEAMFPTLLSLLRSSGDITPHDKAPLNTAFPILRDAVAEVVALSKQAGAVLMSLYALDPALAGLAPEARYDRASVFIGKQFERALRPGGRRHAFRLLAQQLELRTKTAAARPRSSRFVTVDDPDFPDRHRLVAQASQLSVRSRTGASVLYDYGVVISEMLAAGGELRLLTLLPESAAADRAYIQTPSLFQANRAAAIALVDQLKHEVPDPKIRWRETAEPASISQVFVVPRDAPAMALVQMNLASLATGRARPAVVLEESDSWFAAFFDEFEYIWRTRSEERASA